MENHLNYVYRTGAELGEAEAVGLAAYFNSALVDRYFRAISGNTQVNASEIRNMPIPDQARLTSIGERVAALEVRDARSIEFIVGGKLGLCETLIDQLRKDDDE